jgi:hypothetical protein
MKRTISSQPTTVGLINILMSSAKTHMVRSFCWVNHVVTLHASSPTAAKQNCICASLGPVGPSWSFNAEYLWVSLSQGLNHWNFVELPTNHARFLALYVGYITFHHHSCCFLLCCWHQALMSVNFISIFGTFSNELLSAFFGYTDSFS